MPARTFKKAFDWQVTSHGKRTFLAGELAAIEFLQM